MLVVELGFELKNDFNYYDNFLRKNGLINDFNVVTHDIYYTNKNLAIEKYLIRPKKIIIIIKMV